MKFPTRILTPLLSLSPASLPDLGRRLTGLVAERAGTGLGTGQVGSGLDPSCDQPKQSTFLPLNPPAIPLAVRSPYVSTWLPSGNNYYTTPPNSNGNGGYLAGQYPTFWTENYGADGDGRLGWNGLIRVDGEVYEWMGAAMGNTIAYGNIATQTSMEYTATKTIFNFTAGPVDFTVLFLSPITPDDYVRQSLPLSYLYVQVDQATAQGHDVQLYVDIDERWVTAHDYDYANYPYYMKFDQSGGTARYLIQRSQPQLYTEFRQRAEWGSVSWAAVDRPGLTTMNQNNVVAQFQFVTNGKLTGDHGSVAGPDNSFAFAFDMNQDRTAIMSIGLLQDKMLNYIRKNNAAQGYYQQDRYGYWQTVYGNNYTAVVNAHLEEFYDALGNSTVFDQKIYDDSLRVSGLENYYAIVALSARQAFATMAITVPANYSTSDTLVFLKEISSDGDMSTVDVVFPLFPVLSYLKPDLLKHLLEPIFIYTESGLYPNPWCVHDLGVWPNGVGYNKGNDEAMQVEESGNMIIMSLNYAQLSGDDAFLKRHYRILQQWAEFLIEDSLVPAYQLSTDDFAGALANQTNLAIKGINGIGAMEHIAARVGDHGNMTRYRNISIEYERLWEGYALDSAKNHLKLSYQEDSSWGTLYNIFADRLLNLQLIPKSIYDIQDSWYLEKMADYGLPLDSRHNWTKSDWEMFTAAAAPAQEVRDTLINKLHKFVSDEITDAPFTDLYEATTGDFPKLPLDPLIHFEARPVAGGHFALLALDAADKANCVTTYQYGAHGGPNGTDTSTSNACKYSPEDGRYAKRVVSHGHKRHHDAQRRVSRV